jgi:hypothetical protein
MRWLKQMVVDVEVKRLAAIDLEAADSAIDCKNILRAEQGKQHEKSYEYTRAGVEQSRVEKRIPGLNPVAITARCIYLRSIYMHRLGIPRLRPPRIQNRPSSIMLGKGIPANPSQS